MILTSNDMHIAGVLCKSRSRIRTTEGFKVDRRRLPVSARKVEKPAPCTPEILEIFSMWTPEQKFEYPWCIGILIQLESYHMLAMMRPLFLKFFAHLSMAIRGTYWPGLFPFGIKNKSFQANKYFKKYQINKMNK